MTFLFFLAFIGQLCSSALQVWSTRNVGFVRDLQIDDRRAVHKSELIPLKLCFSDETESYRHEGPISIHHLFSRSVSWPAAA